MENQISNHQQQKHARKKADILAAARQIMREEGVAALSMHELARRLDMRAPSLYHYFTSKLDLYDALFRLGFTLYGEQIRPAIQRATTWQEATRIAGEVYFSFALNNPELYQLCFERPVPGFVPSEESLQLSTGLLQAAVHDLEKFTHQMDSGLPPAQTIDLMIAIQHGITALHLANQPHLPLGQGRFGSLLPAMMDLLEKAWTKSAK